MTQTENVWPNTLLVPQAFCALDDVAAPAPGADVSAAVLAVEINAIAPDRSTADSNVAEWR